MIVGVEKKPCCFTDFWTLRIISLTQKTTWNTLVLLYDAVSKGKFKFSIKVNFKIQLDFHLPVLVVQY